MLSFYILLITLLSSLAQSPQPSLDRAKETFWLLESNITSNFLVSSWKLPKSNTLTLPSLLTESPLSLTRSQSKIKFPSVRLNVCFVRWNEMQTELKHGSWTNRSFLIFWLFSSLYSAEFQRKTFTSDYDTGLGSSTTIGSPLTNRSNVLTNGCFNMQQVSNRRSCPIISRFVRQYRGALWAVSKLISCDRGRIVEILTHFQNCP